MKVEIEVLKDVELFCTERVIASYAKHYGRKYYVLYLSMLGFEFDYESSNKDHHKIGKYLDCGFTYDTLMKVTKKYLGLELEFFEASGEDLVMKCKQLLDHGQPIMIQRLKSTLSHWKIIDNEDSYLMLVDYKENYFLCKDMHNSRDKNEIYEIAFSKIIDNDYMPNNTYYIKKNEEKEFTWKELQKDILSTDYFRKDIINIMNIFLEYFSQYFDFEKEQEIVTNTYYIPILYIFMHIYRGRKLIAKAFNKCSELYSQNYFLELSKRCDANGERWRNIWNTLQKAFIIMQYRKLDSNEIDNIHTKTVNRIKEIINEEKIIRDLLINGESSYGNVSQIEIQQKHAEKDLEILNICNQYKMIDLKQYYNSKAFKCKDLKDTLIDFTGMMEYFISDNEVQMNRGNVNYRIEIDQNQKDNISCEGQEILVDGYARYIYIVGCSAWDNDDLFFEIKTAKSIVQYGLALHDWFSIEEFPEDVVGIYDAKVINDKIEKRAIYGSVYEVNDKIKAIKLPNNKNYHIFFIALLQ